MHYLRSLLNKPFFLFFLFATLLLQFVSCRKIVNTVNVTSIAEWNEAPHNAFTDLFRIDSTYYCVFREGSSHTSYDGKLRVIRSLDGKKWSNFDLITLKNKDLRDPHFFTDDYGRLSILAYASDDKVRYNVIYKLHGINFEFEKMNVDNDYWLWNPSKLKGKLYALGYNTKQACFNKVFNSSKPKLMLFQNTDSSCTNFSKVDILGIGTGNFGCPNESSIAITKDSALIAIVRDDDGFGISHIGYAQKPYTNWTWKDFPYYIRGPKLTVLPNGKIFLAAASVLEYNKTYYAIINPDNYTLEKIEAFPSSGDTGYPGVLIDGNTALISYYSSHEGNARVYICRITY